MNGKKGQMILLGFMIMIIVFIIAVQFISPIKGFINTARSPANLDCTNSSITVGNQMTCIALDITMPYIFIAAICAGIVYLTIRKLGSGVELQ